MAVVRIANKSHIENDWLASQGKGDVFQVYIVSLLLIPQIPPLVFTCLYS